MARFELLYAPSIVKDLASLPKTDVRRILARAEALRDDPHPPGSEKLSGSPERYRIRQGDCRILYTVDSQRIVVRVVKIAHRREVYRQP